MALIGLFSNPYLSADQEEAENAYMKVAIISIDNHNKKVNVEVTVWQDQQARVEEKKPIFLKAFTILSAAQPAKKDIDDNIILSGIPSFQEVFDKGLVDLDDLDAYSSTIDIVITAIYNLLKTFNTFYGIGLTDWEDA